MPWALEDGWTMILCPLGLRLVGKDQKSPEDMLSSLFISGRLCLSCEQHLFAGVFPCGSFRASKR